MDNLTKLSCLLGIHQEEWITVDGSGCHQKRRCEVCGIIFEQRERHIWYYLGEWTTTDGSECWQRRRCEVCGIIEQRYIGTMFSDAVYVFGTAFSPTPLWGDAETLPDGTKVSQKILAVQVVLAAFAYLYHKHLIAFVLDERKDLFWKTKTVQVKKLQATAPSTSGLEFALFTSFLDNSDLYSITRAVRSYQWGYFNTWGNVLQIVKDNLLLRGTLKQIVQEKIPFYKYVLNGDLSREKKHVTELQKTLEELHSQGELYQQMLSDIRRGIASKDDTD